MVSQMSASSSLSISITTWSSAHDVRFWKANAISRTRSPSIIGRECRVSHHHRCSIHSGNFCVRWICEEFFLKCPCTISARPFGCSTFSVLSVSWTLSKTGALVFGGGPSKRDDAPNHVASLHRNVAWFRLIFCRALCNVMERLFLFTGSFSRLRS